MFKEYLKIFYRHFTRSPLNSIISIISLSIGIACAVLMLLYINNELSYNDFHENKENIYRVSMRSVMQDQEWNRLRTRWRGDQNQRNLSRNALYCHINGNIACIDRMKRSMLMNSCSWSVVPFEASCCVASWVPCVSDTLVLRISCVTETSVHTRKHDRL